MSQTISERASSGPGRAALAWVAAAVPVAMSVIELVRPTYFGPMGYEPPTILGIPAGLVITAIALAWGALGGVIVARSRSRLALPLVLLLITLPACAVVILAPAIVLILQNLG